MLRRHGLAKRQHFEKAGGENLPTDSVKNTFIHFDDRPAPEETSSMEPRKLVRSKSQDELVTADVK